MLLELKQVQKRYESFLLEVSMKIEKGQVIGFIGANGAGKSTTFKAILGLISLDGGECRIFDKKIEELDLKEKEKIGTVLADACFSGYLTVKDIIPIMDSMYADFSKKEFEEKCRRFEIPLQKQIKEFSTGMKAKLKVLLALSHNAKLLILDEPTSGLDVAAREEILDMLREYMEDGTRGILISSHISSDLEGFCDEVYMIDNGKIIMKEDMDVLLSDYGVLKVSLLQYEELEKEYLIKVRKEWGSYRCLTAHKRYYIENYPQIVVENASIDDFLMLMLRGEDIKKG